MPIRNLWSLESGEVVTAETREIFRDSCFDEKEDGLFNFF
jgi:hypothetical protein